MRKLLSLDQSSKTSGWAVFNDNELIDFGHFTINDSDLGIRLNKIRDKVAQLIADYDINEIIIEDIQLQNNVANNVQTFKTLAEVFGVIYELVTELEIQNSAVVSSVWKSALGIKGKARAEQKQAAQAHINNIYGIKPTSDECDAICIGLYKLQNNKNFDWS